MSYFFTGPAGALFCLFVGLVFIVLYHRGKPKDYGNFGLSIDPFISALKFTPFIFGDANYAIGMEFGGIKWRKEFVDVRLGVSSQVSVPLHNIDLKVQLDTTIAGIGQLTKFDLQFIPTLPMTALAIQVIDEGGKRETIPIAPPPDGFTLTSPSIYRIHLETLPPDSVVNIIIASVAMNPPVSGKLPNEMFAPKRNPEWISIKGYYETGPIEGMKRYPVDFHEQF